MWRVDPMANTVQEALQEISKRNAGVLTAAAVVKAAERLDSPLHSMFTWEDDEAARLWRLHQARNIILRVTVEMETTKDHSVTVRAWASLTPDREEEDGGYRETIRVMRQPEMRAQLLADALAEMERFAEKYRTLTELAEVFSALKRVRKSA